MPGFRFVLVFLRALSLSLVISSSAYAISGTVNFECSDGGSYQGSFNLPMESFCIPNAGGCLNYPTKSLNNDSCDSVYGKYPRLPGENFWSFRLTGKMDVKGIGYQIVGLGSDFKFVTGLDWNFKFQVNPFCVKSKSPNGLPISSLMGVGPWATPEDREGTFKAPGTLSGGGHAGTWSSVTLKFVDGIPASIEPFTTSYPLYGIWDSATKRTCKASFHY